ncbi:MAG: hypothetical protein JOY68_09715 [Candidatus Dormibacteraeota bacterium]|nr:hypothetical protein [Candidatus Dormibacteraeota bacterium]
MRRVRPWLAVVSLAVGAGVPVVASTGSVAQASYGPPSRAAINCSNAAAMCTEVANSDDVFGHYVGHDEPSMLFYSDTAGSGNHMRYDITLPHDPSASDPTKVGKSYQFELSGADWLGMAICDTQSYPEQVKTCPADSDKNILDPAVSPKHVGEAYMEMQFYPPGWVPWPTWQVAVGASSCDPTRWCAALNIDSLSVDPVTGQQLNSTCANKVGVEYVNFAFITKSGKSQGPANPVDATTATFTPDPSKDLFMNDGDNLQVAITDTSEGVKVTIDDLTTGESGSMTASKENGFAQVKYEPTGTSCDAIPYDFHPMYSTSSTKTRVTWAAGSYNVAFDTEIGHFQFCNGPVKIPATPFGLDANGNPTVCPAGDTEEEGYNAEPPDGDDIFCFPGSEALTYKVPGCTYTNVGFDGASYQMLWPDGNTKMHPTQFLFSSPETGDGYDVQYAHAAFETDLPAIESTCDPNSGTGCTLIPQDDDGQPAAFYPFYTDSHTGDGCMWGFGNDVPNEISDYGQNGQYGTLLQQDYTTTGGGTIVQYTDFRGILNSNPCRQG